MMKKKSKVSNFDFTKANRAQRRKLDKLQMKEEKELAKKTMKAR